MNWLTSYPIFTCVFQVAEEGGFLTFPKSDVVLHPEVGMGVFFTYKAASSSAIDDGSTEHTLCPVLRGQTTVVSTHLRAGVAKVTAPATVTLPNTADSVDTAANVAAVDPAAGRAVADATAAGQEKAAKASTGWDWLKM